MSIIIGLTGPTGAGKSTASEAAEKLGFKIVDCDKLAHAAVEKGTAGYNAVITAFKTDILNCDGTIDRKRLAKAAFSSKENTELLNRTLLPHIVLLVKEEADAEMVLLDAPTLFESGINSMCDATVAVLAYEEIRLERITARDGIDNEAAMLRIRAGKPDAFYKENADYIIYNNGETEKFIFEFKKIIHGIMGKI